MYIRTHIHTLLPFSMTFRLKCGSVFLFLFSGKCNTNQSNWLWNKMSCSLDDEEWNMKHYNLPLAMLLIYPSSWWLFNVVGFSTIYYNFLLWIYNFTIVIFLWFLHSRIFIFFSLTHWLRGKSEKRMKNFPIYWIFFTIYTLFTVNLILWLHYAAFTRLPLSLI